MIREDRIKLNDRFIKVFKLLQEKGDVILNDRSGKGIGDFASKILGNRGYGHIIRAFLNKEDKRVIDYHQAKLVCRYYGVNEDYLIAGTGSPFGGKPPLDVVADIFNNGGHPEKGNIMYTTVYAFAGSGESAADIAREEKKYFAIPGVAGGGLVAFHIDGNSMEPEIQTGDMLICRELQNAHEIRNNEVYAVKHDGVLWVKYVQKIEQKGRLTHLKMISANVLEYDPFTIELNDKTRLYKVIRLIGNL